MRRGFTLHELLISLTVMGGVLSLAAHMAMSQLRFFRGASDVVALREQLGASVAVAASALSGASSAAGDIVVAQDSALEFHMAIGTAVVCGGNVGSIQIATPSTNPGNATSSFVESPEPGDAAHAFLSDSLGDSWITLHVTTAPVSSGYCPALLVGPAWLVAFREPITVPPGTVVRFTRPFRLSLYRASDSRWYLGAKDWNGDAERFNTIQPLAGPLRSYSPNPNATGFRFDYFDASGAALVPPFDVRDIAGVALVARAAAMRPIDVPGLASRARAFADSARAFVALRNVR